MQKQFYAVCKNQDGDYQLMGGPYKSKEAALAGGEMNVLNTWGSKHKQYSKFINTLTAMNECEARYFKLV